ncbi:unnamed protein product [Ascophyllum nodosum]
MDIDISSLINEIGVEDADGRIRGEAETVLRLSKTKCLQAGKNEGLRSYVATDLALGKLGIIFSREKLVKASHSKEKVYNEAYQYFRNVLGSQVQGSKIEHFAVKFSGGTTERSRTLLNLYQEACRSTVTAEKSSRLDYNTPRYHAAAFRVATIEAKMNVGRKTLANEVKIDPQELDRICVDMVRKCGLADKEYIAKALRMNVPRSGDKGQGTATKSQEQAGGRIEASPATTMTTRLGLPETSSPGSPENSDDPTGMPEKRLDFSTTGGPHGQASTPVADPTAPLKSFVKRLRKIESPRYEEWVQRALQGNLEPSCR